jgi:hypothetical protein
MRLTSVKKKSGAMDVEIRGQATRKENPASSDSAQVSLAGMQKRQTSRTCLAWMNEKASSKQVTSGADRDRHHSAWRFNPPPGLRLVRELPLPTAMASASALSSFGASSQDARDGCDRLAGVLGRASPINAPTMIYAWCRWRRPLAQSPTAPREARPKRWSVLPVQNYT